MIILKLFNNHYPRKLKTLKVRFLQQSSFLLNNNQKLTDQKFNDRKLNDRKLTDQKLNDQKLNGQKFNDQKLNDQKLNEQKSDSPNSLNKYTIQSLKERLDEHSRRYNKDPDHDWIKFYRFNHIKTAALITKAKFYQTGLVTFIFINSFSSYMSDQNSLNSFIFVNCVATFSLLFLILVGNLARRIVGIAYYNPKDSKLIRISHLTFFGRRNNLVLNLNDIRPLSDTNKSVDPLFFKLIININGKDKKFYLANSNFATIDEKIYENVFGLLK